MKSRRLNISLAARRDLERREDYLARQRGWVFAASWSSDFVASLTKTAATGAVVGTRHPRRSRLRSLNYKKQATVLVEFTEDELRLARIYFPGQDWSR